MKQVPCGDSWSWLLSGSCGESDGGAAGVKLRPPSSAPLQLLQMFHMRVSVLLQHASDCVLFRTVGAAAASIMNDGIKD